MRLQKELPSQEWLQERLRYDPETGELTWKTRPRSDFKSLAAWSIWRAKCEGKRAGLVTNTRDKYIVVQVACYKFMAHRLIWKLVTGVDPAEEIDHISRDRTDNRIANLREVTARGNAQNRGIQSNNRSGVSGVWWNPKRNLWEAFITVKGVKKLLGRFNTLGEATLAREKAKQKLNFLGPSDPPTLLHEITSGPELSTDQVKFNLWANRMESLSAEPSKTKTLNRKTRPDNTSGHRGVTWHAKAKKWMAYLNFNGKHHHLGLFTELGEAVSCRLEAERKLGVAKPR